MPVVVLGAGSGRNCCRFDISTGSSNNIGLICEDRNGTGISSSSSSTSSTSSTSSSRRSTSSSSSSSSSRLRN